MRRVAVGLSLLALALAGCTANAAAPRETPLSRSASAVSSAPATPRSTATPVGDYPIDVTFVSPHHGWLLALPDNCSARCPLTVERTSDGALTWHRVSPGTPMPVSDPAVPSRPTLYATDDRNAWILDGALWATHDGGEHWHQLALTGKALAVAPAGRDVLLLTSARSGPLVWRSPADREAWHEVARLQPGGRLLTRSGDHVYVLPSGYDQRPTYGLAVSADAGATFQARRDPCGSRADSESIAASGASVWVLCADEPQTGIYQPRKVVHVSLDGGRSWRVAGRPSTSGSFGQLRFGTSSAGLLLLDRGRLTVTEDGGRTWHVVSPPDDDTFWAGGFASRTMAYALRAGELWVSRDAGRHWAVRRR